MIIKKIALLGDASVGKTALISKFTKDVFPEAHVATTSDAHAEAIVDLGDKKFKVDIHSIILVCLQQTWKLIEYHLIISLHILDTNPSEDRTSATRLNWYNWADAFMIVFSINHLKSFENAYTVFTYVEKKPQFTFLCLTKFEESCKQRELESHLDWF